MEALFSAVLSDLVGRATSFVIQKCREQATPEEDLQRLQQLVLRIRAIIDEAEGRSVGNRAMIHQVSAMRNQMFRGYYLLDAFKCREKKGEEMSLCSFAPSEFNPAKRFRRLSSNTTQVEVDSRVIGGERNSNKELKRVILGLESMIADTKEFAIFLMSYPRMYRQPYNAYLFLNCMFGRHKEREETISFLLQAEPQGSGNLGVLPIVGPALIGKSTLVEHVCDDERVRNHFSLILLHSGNDLQDGTTTTFRDDCVIKHQNTASDEERSLVIIELLGDVDDGAWKRLLNSSERFMTQGSKIIITSRSDKVVSLGTTEAVRLKCLPKEAYWYFFKTIVFGSADPEEHPKLTSIAMELALDMHGSFMCAHFFAALLRADLDARLWCRILSHYREFLQKNTLLFGEYPEGRPRYICRLADTQRGSKDRKYFLLDDSYHKGPAAHGEFPGIALVDLVSGTGGAVAPGRFGVFFWRSLIPPYYSYRHTCELVRHKNTTVQRKKGTGLHRRI